VPLRVPCFRNYGIDTFTTVAPQGYDQAIFPCYVFHAAPDSADFMATAALSGSYRTGPDEFRAVKNIRPGIPLAEFMDQFF